MSPFYSNRKARYPNRKKRWTTNCWRKQWKRCKNSLQLKPSLKARKQMLKLLLQNSKLLPMNSSLSLQTFSQNQARACRCKSLKPPTETKPLSSPRPQAPIIASNANCCLASKIQLTSFRLIINKCSSRRRKSLSTHNLICPWQVPPTLNIEQRTTIWEKNRRKKFTDTL